MKQTMNYDGMSYNELVAQKMELENAINKMREQEMKRAIDDLLKYYSITKEDFIRIYFGEEDAPVPVSVEKTETELPTMAELLSDVPEYKELYSLNTPIKKSNRKLPTMDELLSDDPTNRILCLGNLNPKGAPYRQHSRINHADGIIPTETATGQTMIYIPPRKPKPTMTA